MADVMPLCRQVLARVTVVPVSRLADGPADRGGTVAPVARNLVVMALTARDIVVVDAAVDRLPSTSSLSTPAAALTVLGRRRPPFMTASLSAWVALVTAGTMVGWRRPPLVTLPSLTAARLMRCAATAAASSELAAALAYARKTTFARSVLQEQRYTTKARRYRF
jgi:hypothetical protein